MEEGGLRGSSMGPSLTKIIRCQAQSRLHLGWCTRAEDASGSWHQRRCDYQCRTTPYCSPIPPWQLSHKFNLLPRSQRRLLQFQAQTLVRTLRHITPESWIIMDLYRQAEIPRNSDFLIVDRLLHGCTNLDCKRNWWQKIEMFLLETVWTWWENSKLWISQWSV